MHNRILEDHEKLLLQRRRIIARPSVHAASSASTRRCVIELSYATRKREEKNEKPALSNTSVQPQLLSRSTIFGITVADNDLPAPVSVLRCCGLLRIRARFVRVSGLLRCRSRGERTPPNATEAPHVLMFQGVRQSLYGAWARDSGGVLSLPATRGPFYEITGKNSRQHGRLCSFALVTVVAVVLESVDGPNRLCHPPWRHSPHSGGKADADRRDDGNKGKNG